MEEEREEAEVQAKCPECGGTSFRCQKLETLPPMRANIAYCASCGHIIGVPGGVINPEYQKVIIAGVATTNILRVRVV
uniref:TFIIB-type domain-containing protein n=1 Tax=Candidatus Methanophagaceae archaeon ANME-1 ERB6 TaxID=2759912 RepID=A0A7G9Z047_9EURY|nr:hypothetical protein NGENPBHE_00031 [Methanosarcinales archaeon ANME-1 ERB6]